jgi:hypothetical protein
VLWARPAGGSWRIVSTVVTTADGRGAASVTPRVNTRYRWVFDGDDSHYAASSASPLIKVKQAVTAKITKHSARRFSTVRVYGTVKPKAAGKRVALQRRSHGRWVSVHSGATIQRQVLPNGIRTLSYVITIPTYNRGRSLYRVHRAATSTNASGNSRAISLRIR